MNRREAIAALMGLPAATRITRAAVTPTDVIVIESDGTLTEEGVVNIHRAIKAVWPDNRVAVLDGGLKLKIAETKA